MKKIILFAALVAGVAIAGDYIVGAETQTGNGSNGNTRAAPTLATEGVPVVTSVVKPGVTKPVATKARVTMRAASTNTIQNASDLSWLRCYRYGMDPRDSTGATYIWAPCAALDLKVDAGVGSTFKNSLTFPVVNLGEVDKSGNRYLWACENCQQSGAALDAGMAISVEMLTP